MPESILSYLITLFSIPHFIFVVVSIPHSNIPSVTNLPTNSWYTIEQEVKKFGDEYTVYCSKETSDTNLDSWEKIPCGFANNVVSRENINQMLDRKIPKDNMNDRALYIEWRKEEVSSYIILDNDLKKIERFSSSQSDRLDSIAPELIYSEVDQMEYENAVMKQHVKELFFIFIWAIVIYIFLFPKKRKEKSRLQKLT